MTYRDGATVWVGLDKLVDSWFYQSGTVQSIGTVTMYANMWSSLMVEHASSSASNKLQVEWSRDGGAYQTLQHATDGSNFQFAYDGGELAPAQLGTTYFQGQVFANDLVNMSAGAYLPYASFFTGRTSELNNDAGFVATAGNTLTGTASNINGPYASISGTLSLGNYLVTPAPFGDVLSLISGSNTALWLNGKSAYTGM